MPLTLQVALGAGAIVGGMFWWFRRESARLDAADAAEAQINASSEQKAATGG